MAVHNPRNRMLIFRLTEDEYNALQTASSGARSLSEFARAKLLASVAAPPDDLPITERLNDLDTKVARIAEMLEKS